MDKLEILGTPHTPHIIFDGTNNKLSITGRSIPEEADIYYYPIFKWLEGFIKEVTLTSVNRKTIDVIFDLEYYNTLSYRYLNKVMSLLADLKKLSKLNIEWYYETKDEDMEEMGQDFNESYNLKMKLIKIERKH